MGLKQQTRGQKHGESDTTQNVRLTLGRVRTTNSEILNKVTCIWNSSAQISFEKRGMNYSYQKSKHQR